MPELPEVETTRRGIAPHIENKPINDIIVRQSRLRWPVPSELPILLRGLNFHHIGRRGKYLLFECATGTLIVHLGMSGSLRIVAPSQNAGKHDHVDWVFTDDTVLRFNDPRKFGTVLWSDEPAASHPLLARLGPEPLSAEFDGEYLYRLSRGRKTAIKSFIMDGHIVVGVGNIYANESLFMAGILPSRQAGRISFRRYQALADAIKTVLQSAIEQGGTTLRDFVNENGKPGYFQQSLFVYGRAGQPCLRCSTPIKQIKIGQRASYFCQVCQA